MINPATYTATVWNETRELVDYRRGDLIEVIRWARMFVARRQPNTNLEVTVAPNFLQAPTQNEKEQ